MLSVAMFSFGFRALSREGIRCVSFLNKHAVDMFNEFLFSLGDFGKMCLPQPYTNIVCFQILPVGFALGKAPILTQFLVKQIGFALFRRSPVMYLNFPNFVFLKSTMTHPTIKRKPIYAYYLFWQNFMKPIKDNDLCTFCKEETDTLLHLFWQCKVTSNFWETFFQWLQSSSLIQKGNHLAMATALGLKPDNSNTKLQINFSCLMSRYYIWKCKLRDEIPNLSQFLRLLKKTYEIETNGLNLQPEKWKPLLGHL